VIAVKNHQKKKEILPGPKARIAPKKTVNLSQQLASPTRVENNPHQGQLPEVGKCVASSTQATAVGRELNLATAR